jgi:hypothetical protein
MLTGKPMWKDKSVVSLVVPGLGALLVVAPAQALSRGNCG